MRTRQPLLHHKGCTVTESCHLDLRTLALPTRTVEVYIDDIVVKSEMWVEHVQYLEEAFCLMWAYNMKLAKCAFGISVGKFLGFMVTQRGFEVNTT